MQLLDLHDEARARPIPVAFDPADESAPWLLFSVGFGGGRGGYAYLARAWNDLGFNVAVVEHVGSNLAVLQGLGRRGTRQSELAEKVGEAVRDEAELRARPQDLWFVRRFLCSPDSWVGAAGHSFGSYTALAALGCETVVGSFAGELPWQGALVLSPQPPGAMITAGGFGSVEVPVFTVTGTRDSGMPAGIDFEARRQVYRALPAGLRWGAVLKGADHMSFAAVGLNTAPVTETVAALSCEFWSALREGREPRWPQGLPVEVQFESD